MNGNGFDAILNIRGTAMLESLVVRGYSISRDTAEKLVESNAIVGNVISPADHYYLYKWLMTGGKYIWNNNDQLFYPAENMSLEAISSANSKAIMKMQAVDVGKYAASLGNSIETLENVLYENERSYNESLTEDELRVDFKGELSGEELDYLYVSGNVGEDYTAKIFGDNHTAKNVIEDRLMKHAYNSGLRCVIEWMDDAGGVHTMSSVAENGKLLIPIGAGTGWLCNDHKYVKIWFEKDGDRVSFPDEYQIRLFRVRDMSLPAGN